MLLETTKNGTNVIQKYLESSKQDYMSCKPHS